MAPQQWLVQVESGISMAPRAFHRSHLYEFAKVRKQSGPWCFGARLRLAMPFDVYAQMSSAYTREMSALANQLQHLNWEDRDHPIAGFFFDEVPRPIVLALRVMVGDPCPDREAAGCTHACVYRRCTFATYGTSW
jgi:hypothetical protein